MGITKFKKYLNQVPKIKFAGKLSDISSLFIDCNGIFHMTKASVYKNGRDMSGNFVHTREERDKIKKMDPKTLEKKHIKAIIKKLDEILVFYKPSDTLILAPDGMANCAKMQQQKERRYDYDPEDNEVFAGASISPGTEFMIHLDEAIRLWLKDNPILPKKTIYSSHLQPGEGEHKIFDFIREGQLENLSGNHVVYGADGDLFIISLFSRLRNIYLATEDFREYFVIENFKRYLRTHMSYNNYKGDGLIRDFCFLTFMIGNDFIHRLPNLYDTPTSLNILTDVYKKTKKNLVNFEHQIIWPNFLSYLKNLREFKLAGYKLYEFNYASTFTQYHNKRWVRYPEIEQATTIKDLRGNIVTDELYDSSKHTFEFNLKKFSVLWYNKQFKPRNKKVAKYYKDDKYYSGKDVQNMCKYYLQTLQWATYYYNLGPRKVSDYLFYPYFYTPLLESVIGYLDSTLKKKDFSFTKNILLNRPSRLTVIHQLMMIMPPQLSHLIPEPFRSIYKDKLVSLSPSKFKTIEQEGSDVDYKNVKLIPPINPYLVTKFIEESGHEIPSKYHLVGPFTVNKNKAFDGQVNYTVKQEIYF